MYKKVFVSFCALLLIGVGSTLWAQEPVATPETAGEQPVPTAEEASRAVGVLYGTMIESVLKRLPGGTELDPKVILSTMNELLVARKEGLMSQADASGMLDRFVSFKTEERNKRTLDESKSFLAENAKKEGVATTASGLQYLIIREGTGVKPTVEDTVLVHYKGQLLDGTVFDDSYERGEPVKFSPLQVIPGWTEGLCLLSKGAKARLFIPYELAYGERGIGTSIPPYATLIFDIELIDVIKGEPIPMVEPTPRPEPSDPSDTPTEEEKE